jgi:hypothetical protein
MRSGRAAASALAVAAIFLGGCGHSVIIDPVPVPPHHMPFGQRAAAVLTSWRHSGAARLWNRGLDRRWFTGLVLLDSTRTREWGDEPCDASCQDIVRYRLAAPLPSRHPRVGAVTFPGRSAPLRLPLIGAATAFGALPREPRSGCADPGAICRTVTVTRVRLRTVTVPTSRGDARLPAWEFDFSRGGLPDEFDQVAVAPPAVTTLPDPLLAPPPDLQRYAPVVSITPAQGDPRRIAVRADLPSGTAEARIAVLQTPGGIVIGALITRSCTHTCPARRYRTTIGLTAPIGHRVILDAATGRPAR